MRAHALAESFDPMNQATAKKVETHAVRADGTGEAEGPWPLDTAAKTMLGVLKWLCPFWWCIDFREARRNKKNRSQDKRVIWDGRRALWVVVWLGVLIVAWCRHPESSLWKGIVGGAAALRLWEIAVTGAGTAMKDEQQVRARSMISIGIYFLTVTFAFAILYHSFAATRFKNAEGAAEPAHDALDYLYISWANITSLGTDSYFPTNDTARFLEVATTTFGIFLLGVLLAFGIDAVKKQRGGA